MKNNKFQAVVMIFAGCIIVASGFFIYYIANTIYPDASSSRVQDMNFLLRLLGKKGLTILVCLIGILIILQGMRYYRKPE